MLAIGQEDAVNTLRFFDDLPDPRRRSIGSIAWEM